MHPLSSGMTGRLGLSSGGPRAGQAARPFSQAYWLEGDAGMSSLAAEHQARALQHLTLAAFERAQGHDRAASRHEVIADSYQKAARILADTPLPYATPRQPLSAP